MEKSWAYRQDQLPTTHPIFAEINDLEDVEVNFDGITYAKGASVLRQLVAWVGPEQFMAGVREYFRKHAWQNTELSDLMAELENGQRPRPGRVGPALAGNRRRQHAQARARRGRATGRSPPSRSCSRPYRVQPTIRPHRLAVGFYNLTGAGKLERVHREELDVDGGRTEVPALAGLARPDLILLNDDDLAYAKVRLDPQSLRHGHGPPEGLQPEPAPDPGVGFGLGRGPRRRDPGPRLRGTGPGQHRRTNPTPR